MAYKRKTVKRPAGQTKRNRRRKRSGHPVFHVLLIICLVLFAAWMAKTDFLNSSPSGTAVMTETEIHHRNERKDASEAEAGHEETIGEKIKRTLSRAESSSEQGNKKATEDDSLWGKIVSAVIPDNDSRGKGRTGEQKEKSAATEDQSRAVKASDPSSTQSPDTSGAIPKTGQKPSVGGRGNLAVVIDDAGRDLASQRVYEGLGVPFTLAVMPNQIHTRDAAAEWAALGYPVILHQPMESVSGAGMEEKTILTSMSDSAIRSMLSDSLSQVPEASGINNHQGSKATTDPRVMGVIMSELARRGLFFLDSHTNTTTAADTAAANYGVPYGQNHLFVDNSPNEGDIEAMIQEAADRAKKYGSYVIIGHCRPATAEAFRRMVPKLRAEGIEFIPLSTLLR